MRTTSRYQSRSIRREHGGDFQRQQSDDVLSQPLGLGSAVAAALDGSAGFPIRANEHAAVQDRMLAARAAGTLSFEPRLTRHKHEFDRAAVIHRILRYPRIHFPRQQDASSR
jgi:hypothetical protein